MNSQIVTGVIAACAAVGVLLSTPAEANDVKPGHDLFVTPPGTAWQDFGTSAQESAPEIPADFFDPGSGPFTGHVPLQGLPIGVYCDASDCFGVGPGDTLISRIDTAVLPNVGDEDTIDIELIALSLVSADPITVMYDDAHEEEWNLTITPSPTTLSTGWMVIKRESATGGTYDAWLEVYVLFTFTRVSDGEVRTLDSGTIGYAAHVWIDPDVPPPTWDHVPTNPGQQVLFGLTGDKSNIDGEPWTYDFYIVGPSRHRGPHPRVDPPQLPPGECGNDIIDPLEQCDGESSGACSGECIECTCVVGEIIPTVSEWGLIIMTLIGFTVATILYRRRRTAEPATH